MNERPPAKSSPLVVRTDEPPVKAPVVEPEPEIETPSPVDGEALLRMLGASSVYPEDPGCAFGWFGDTLVYLDADQRIHVYVDGTPVRGRAGT